MSARNAGKLSGQPVAASATAKPRAPYVALCPGYGSARSTGWDRKLWPHGEELIARLTERRVPVVIVGGADDASISPCRSVSVRVPTVLDLRGRLTLRQAAGVLARAARVVTIDNGLAHVAAAAGAPVTALFGFTSPVKNRPMGPRVRVLTAGLDCQPCQMTPREHTCRQAECMRAITVDQVLEAMG